MTLSQVERGHGGTTPLKKEAKITMQLTSIVRLILASAFVVLIPSATANRAHDLGKNSTAEEHAEGVVAASEKA